MMNSTTATIVELDNSISTEECKERELIKDIRGKFDGISRDCLENITPRIYFAERLLQGLIDNHFNSRPDFGNDRQAQAIFICDYEYMAAQLWTIRDILFDIRLKTEFVNGDKDDPFIAAHIRNEDEMRSWLRSAGKEFT